MTSKSSSSVLKILHVHPYLKALNGSERLLFETVKNWPYTDKHFVSTVGCKVDIPKELAIDIHTPKIVPRKESVFAYIWSFVFLPATSLKGEADIVIAHSGAAIFAAAVRKLFRRGKLIYLCHEPPRYLYDLWSMTLSRRKLGGRIILHIAAPFIKVIDKWAVSRADLSIVLSSYSAHEFYKIYGRHAVVEQAGVDYKKFYAKPIKPTQKTLVTVGKLHPRKNVSLLLKALSSSQLKDFHLSVIGGGPQKEELESMTNSLRINDRVKWLGSVNDTTLRRLYHSSSVFVFCAYDEPFGLVVLEAMSAGIPIVVPNQGGPQEIVASGRFGVCYMQDDPSSLAESILEASRKDIHQIEKAQKHASTFTWKRYANAIADITRK